MIYDNEKIRLSFFPLKAVERWIVDRAVLPIENSLGGSIHRNYDLLLRHRLHIVGEVKFAVRHCLLANHGVKIEELKRVLSHPQVIRVVLLYLDHINPPSPSSFRLNMVLVSGSCSV